ncbi:hypothetical protein [Streptomyces mesophilus]|uniref:hypothetical protein n=1 Tax=Streptomyces mesophilus TaxID=1775132 RepID=UPI003318657A
MLIAVLLFLFLVALALVAIGALCATLVRMAGAGTGWTIAVALLSPPVALSLLFLILASR